MQAAILNKYLAYLFFVLVAPTSA